jgi:hypothetical protein
MLTNVTKQKEPSVSLKCVRYIIIQRRRRCCGGYITDQKANIIPDELFSLPDRYIAYKNLSFKKKYKEEEKRENNIRITAAGIIYRLPFFSHIISQLSLSPPFFFLLLPFLPSATTVHTNSISGCHDVKLRRFIIHSSPLYTQGPTI